MIRLALGKGRNLGVTLDAFRAAGVELGGFDPATDRRLKISIPGAGLEVLLLKDSDLPLYLAHGVADLGVVGSDVLEESDGDLLVPLRLHAGRARLSFIGRPGSLPLAGTQVRLATKYPLTARRAVARRSWGAEILPLAGSVELAPLLGLAEIGLDVVQTGRTLAENGLVELEWVAEVAASVAVNRASFLGQRMRINELLGRLEAAGVAS
jgi:ATP phosphoribosyltransferase